MTTKEIVEEHMKAAKRVERRLMSSRKAAVQFLIRAGVLDKTGKKLANKCRG